MHLQFEGIRCFGEPQDAVIRPITLLVGENSSGKTTFLALCRIAHATANGSVSNPPFNDDPFWLGAYDQIASHPRGGAGRAKYFSLAISVDDEEYRCSLRTEYVPRAGQPSPRIWRLQAGDLAIQVSSEDSSHGAVLMESPLGKKSVPYPRGHNFHLLTLLRPDQWMGSTVDESIFSHSDGALLGDALEHIRRGFLRSPYAFAPIRTSPKRTYDPVVAEPNPEGSHVPMLLAAFSRSAQQQHWAALQAALTEFGASSGLFEKIEIINKGRTEGDPFQIGVKSGGRTFNLIDVGYGVSQALPILVDILHRTHNFQSFLLQQPEVHLHPKAQAELGSFFAKQATEKRRFVIETHSDHLVDRIRMEVRRRLLAPEDVSLLYFERGKSGATIHNLELDANGSIANPPPGYRQFFLKEERDLLGI
ncbi:MAG: AAA family ATPase [Bryobacteraceae bacterium]